ncbi:helix-turn-helix domain-containing protein [Clostridium perfringens]|uniref:helix-turn-helix domain-containing protein n=2 Tax=Clostridium perfringens TaxID=1502 RepID=UPI0004208FBD|nr:helix-turn-helix transcriptional regulator [Clostridium perfringens]EHK2349774.1 helix-turn-helix domain-containing protein [Clostridium perfringens]EJT6477317.1 helix-turn-helix domain-containing protein [Clostridium perfringens]ELC8342885.1 helix-turn-helix domain-containing protein [Clostridium perfringens]ELC8354822.1 helix-turn-helix domain-containing protein [Clostridium perfringens]ELC8454407.1 helix-turn-helix domain-containing protein [Clostridium perfringens]
MNLNEKITFYREKKGISKSQLAREIGVSPAYITKLENGEKTNPSLELKVKIANALEQPLTVFLENNPTNNNIGSKIKSAKILNNLDDNQLSEITGIDKLQLRSIQDGQVNPTKMELEIISKALKLPTNYFTKDSTININETGNIEDKYNINELQLKFGLNKENMTIDELYSLIYFYQNQNSNLNKRLKIISNTLIDMNEKIMKIKKLSNENQIYLSSISKHSKEE